MLFKGSLHSSPSYFCPSFETDVGKNMFHFQPFIKKQNIRSLFQKNIATMPCVTHHWRKFAPDIVWRKVWTFSSKYFITDKPRDVCFKLLHRCKISPAHRYWQKLHLHTYSGNVNLQPHFGRTSPSSCNLIFWKISVFYIRMYYLVFTMLTTHIKKTIWCN